MKFYTTAVVSRREKVKIGFAEERIIFIDFVIFQGDLEQMSIVAKPSTVSLQCSSQRTPIVDPSVKIDSFEGNAKTSERATTKDDERSDAMHHRKQHSMSSD